MRRKLIYFVPLGIVAVLVFITVGGLVVQWLWNWLVPAIFGWRPITFWQGIGLLALCRILFGGIGRHGWHHGSNGHRLGRRWSKMTPEEKEQFRQRFRERCGFAPPTVETEPKE
jgi:hypothetical protein